MNEVQPVQPVQHQLDLLGVGQRFTQLLRKYEIEICLQHIDCTTNELTSGEKSETYKAIPHYYSQPCAIWVVVNDREKHQLSKLSHSDEWKSGTFNTVFHRPQPINQFKCDIWIKFKSFGIGEMKALQVLTDYFYFQQANCDIQFRFKDGQHIGGHKKILSARSPVFDAMFSHEMKEATTGQVLIQDIQPEIFKELLHFIYLGRTQEPLKNITAIPLFVAADKYDIGDLKQECVSFLITQIRLENAINLMIWAHHNSVNEVKEAALKLVVSNGKAISQTDGWEQLTKNYPDLCLMATRRMLEMLVNPSTL